MCRSRYDWTYVSLTSPETRRFMVQALDARAQIVEVLDLVPLIGTGWYVVHALERRPIGSGQERVFAPAVYLLDSKGEIIASETDFAPYSIGVPEIRTSDPLVQLSAKLLTGGFPHIGSDSDHTFWVGREADECKQEYYVEAGIGSAPNAPAAVLRRIGLKCP